MRDEIKIVCKGREYTIPNQWAAISPTTWLRLVRNYQTVESGQLSVGELRIRLLCDMMGWNWRKMKSEDGIANLIVLSEQLTFPFRIVYQDKHALDALTNEQYAQAVRMEPDHIGAPWAEALCDKEWYYQLDLCFFQQLMPTVMIGSVQMFGYKAENHHGALSTSLTALQFIEATEALAAITPDGEAPGTVTPITQHPSPITQHPSPGTALHRLAAILYAPEPYNSNQAHAIADEFAYLKPVELEAIRMNFMALTNFLYTKTPFSLLTKFEKDRKTRTITTTMTDALYDLCNDGLGNSQEVEQLNLLTYLRILRKKTIDAVRQLHGLDMDIAKIANETGLPPEVIAKII